MRPKFEVYTLSQFLSMRFGKYGCSYSSARARAKAQGLLSLAKKSLGGEWSTRDLAEAVGSSYRTACRLVETWLQNDEVRVTTYDGQGMGKRFEFTEDGGAKTFPPEDARAGSFRLAFGKGLLPGQKHLILPRGGKPVREMLVWQAWNELAAIEGIDRLKLLACAKQLRNLVRCILNLLKYVFAGFLRVQYDDNQDIILGPLSVMGVYKVTHELSRIETARRPRTGIGAKEQRHMEARLVGAINNRRYLTKPVEKVTAMSALGGISLQRSTPYRGPGYCGRLTHEPVNSEEGTDHLPIRTDGTAPNDVGASDAPIDLQRIFEDAKDALRELAEASNARQLADEHERQRQRIQAVSDAAKEIVEKGYKMLTLQFHTDRIEGDGEKMRNINAAVIWLRGFMAT